MARRRKATASAATAPVPDLTDGQWDYGGSDGEIFAVIHDGVSADMDGYAARLSDADIWNVVNYRQKRRRETVSSSAPRARGASRSAERECRRSAFATAS